MPPKKHNNKNNNNQSNKPHDKKHKKQAEEDEFEKLLSDLTKVTKQVGQEKEKQQQHDEQIRAEIQKKHEDLLKKKEPTHRLEEELVKHQRKMEFQDLLRKLMMAQRPFLDAPKEDFSHESDNSNPHFKATVGAMQGWRNSMEDNHFIHVHLAAGDATEGLFGVFDGHSGKQSADLCSKQLPALCAAKRSGAGAAIDFEAAYLAMDAALQRDVKDGSGCTAVVVHVSAGAVRCASVGDSRAVLCQELVDAAAAGAAAPGVDEVTVAGRTFRVHALAHDHKPEVEAERARIVAAGGFVEDNRVNGQLAMSRALGDFSYKTNQERGVDAQLVIPVPTVLEVPRGAAGVADRFVVLACDGIFDVLRNEELVRLVLEKKLEAQLDNVQCCEAVCRHCLAPPDGASGQPSRAEGTDNMTVMIVDLE
ncbi:protein phosphatase [Strigomonas culicis]|uniref:protein-serine/threonine phosphatase n=1 Tax=Strigomonas culicis TaxID=28005 RepID=S9VX65_9TRYP|nr:protein phosphatase [Strigomonas culicis]|eukprot:EPY28180.1 protein phosphatase [Strigomonas culicis]